MRPDRLSGADCSRPAVSIAVNSMSPSRPWPSRRSRVTPGRLSTRARRRPTSRLNKVDLPTLGRPTMARVKLIGYRCRAGAAVHKKFKDVFAVPVSLGSSPRKASAREGAGLRRRRPRRGGVGLPLRRRRRRPGRLGLRLRGLLVRPRRRLLLLLRRRNSDRCRLRSRPRLRRALRLRLGFVWRRGSRLFVRLGGRSLFALLGRRRQLRGVSRRLVALHILRRNALGDAGHAAREQFFAFARKLLF